MPVTDVNENFSSPINGNNEQDGFNGEPTQQPTTAINTVIIFFKIFFNLVPNLGFPIFSFKKVKLLNENA